MGIIVINGQQFDSEKQAAAWKKMLAQRGVLAEANWYNDSDTTVQDEEELLREKYPAAKEAWERYQAIIKLVKDGKDGKPQT